MAKIHVICRINRFDYPSEVQDLIGASHNWEDAVEALKSHVKSIHDDHAIERSALDYGCVLDEGAFCTEYVAYEICQVELK